MDVRGIIESYRFWDVVSLWARERLVHEVVVARELAKGVLEDGLRVQSVDPEWTTRGTFDMAGNPYVGYVAKEGCLPIIIRASAMKHLTDIVEKGAEPNKDALFEEFILRTDFQAWLESTRSSPVEFWGQAE